MKKGKLTRDLSKKECPWLGKELKKGLTVFQYDGYTYGCVTDSGIAVTDKPGILPFFEVPKNSVVWE